MALPFLVFLVGSGEADRCKSFVHRGLGDVLLLPRGKRGKFIAMREAQEVKPCGPASGTVVRPATTGIRWLFCWMHSLCFTAVRCLLYAH